MRSPTGCCSAKGSFVVELASNAVVHLAARSNDRLGDLNPDWTYEINITATVSLARAAKQAGALFELTGHGFVPVSMRNATAWNASPRLRLDIVLNNLVGWAHTTGAIRLQSDGTSWGPLVHLRDIAGYAQALLDAPADAVAGEAFNVGSREQNHQVRELTELVNRAYPACELTVADGAASDPHSYRVNFSKLEQTFPTVRCE